MTATGNGSIALPKTRRSFRPNLRQATFIAPRTGERVRRAVTLQSPTLEAANRDGPVDDSALLTQGRRLPKTSTFRAIQQDCEDRIWKLWAFANSKNGQGILKCSLAYLIGSMATFVPLISDLLGQQDGKHMVATVTVYFHPARSQGSMFEAVGLAILAFIYAAVISFSSMGISILFGRTFDLMVLGHTIVLIVFCGGGLGLVGWVKQRLANPLVNVACSLTSLALITVLTKEGAVQAVEYSDDKVEQVMYMIIMGVTAATVVCFLIRPISARKELRQNMIHVTDSFGDMLAMITRSFLLGNEEDLEHREFIAASDRYRSVFASLTKNLREAKFEHYVLGTEAEYQLEAKLVKCMQRMAQNIGGLRSAATTQFDLLSQAPSYGGTTPSASIYTPVAAPNMSLADSWLTSQENCGGLTAIHEHPEEDGTSEYSSDTEHQNGEEDIDNLPTVQSPVEIFDRFITHLGPSMKSLAYTLKQILDDLPYGPAPDFKIAVNTQFHTSLVQAIRLYSDARTQALALLYGKKDSSSARPTELEADFEEVAASCGHFSFSLQDFAEEMRVYLDILDDIKEETERLPRQRSWNWLKFWRDTTTKEHPSKTGDMERDSLIAPNGEMDVPSEMASPLDRTHLAEYTSEKARSLSSAYTRYLWKVLRVFRRDDIKFGIKVGAGAAMFALPSFLFSTREFYQHWRGEWGLLSYMLVCSMTIGASNTTGFARFFGTCIGAICAVFTWTASQGNAFVLAAFGWLMSLGTSYLIVAAGKAPLGRFIMLTYNLSALYAYSLSVRDDDDDDDEGGVNPMISEIAVHRVVAVLSGCLWGLIVTRLVWPISARSKFKDGLSLLWLRMGLIWKRDPLAMLLDGESPNAYMKLREEFELQRFVSRLENLRGAAESEFELRGPFPKAAYGRILKSTSRMLDAFHAMNVVINKDLKASDGEAELLRYTVRERAQLCSRISHLFQVLASSMKLEFPLNDAFPSTDHARDRLLAKIFKYRRDGNIAQGTTDEDYGLLYAYALVTGQLSKEIKEIGKEIETLFGVLDEDLFKLQ
ncbi:hypothetical protein MMC34_005728 [Xylographa carneopallida]|nr:hypothetical protein [Xylographa carneopallida]